MKLILKSILIFFFLSLSQNVFAIDPAPEVKLHVLSNSVVKIDSVVFTSSNDSNFVDHLGKINYPQESEELQLSSLSPYITTTVFYSNKKTISERLSGENNYDAWEITIFEDHIIYETTTYFRERKLVSFLIFWLFLYVLVKIPLSIYIHQIKKKIEYFLFSFFLFLITVGASYFLYILTKNESALIFVLFYPVFEIWLYRVKKYSDEKISRFIGLVLIEDIIYLICLIFFSLLYCLITFFS